MRARRYSQIAATLVANPWFYYLSSRKIFQGKPKGVCFPGMNCYACPLAMYSCPIGALQHSLVTRSFGAFAYVMGTLGAIGALVGRLPCGWVCPFGLLQELLYRIPVPKVRLPRRAGYLKYVALGVLAVMLPLLVSKSWYSRLCPVGTLEGGIPLQLLPPSGLPRSALQPHLFFWLKIAILAVFLLWMMVTSRPFCRTACPLGAIWSLFNPVSLYRMEVDPHRCTRCGICRDVCPVDIDIYRTPNSPECVRCLECRRACPHGAVTAGFRALRRSPVPGADDVHGESIV